MSASDPTMINVTSAHQAWPNKTEGARVWAEFLKNGSFHSKLARYLPYVVQRAERERIPYIIVSQPYGAYYCVPVSVIVERMDAFKQSLESIALTTGTLKRTFKHGEKP